jgi:hypothetical protein
MRRSTILLIGKHIHGPRASLLGLALFTVLAASSPAIAQKETPPQVVVHTAAYTAYGKEKAPVVKEEPGEATIPIKVTPNPTTGSFRARLLGSKEEQVRVEILDQQGRLIDTRQVSAGAELRFGYWYQPGVYFFHIIQGDRRKKVKLVKVED